MNDPDAKPTQDPGAMTVGMMTVLDGFTPYLDAASGMRADLERRGWSPTQAEVCAAEWLRGAIATAWVQVGLQAKAEARSAGQVRAGQGRMPG